MNTTTPRPGGSAVHRLLDELFAGLPATPDALDLKEEVRGNLVARATELEAEGRTPDDAARIAVDELGDVRELLEEAPAERSSAAIAAANRVRHRPAFVVRTVLISIASGLSLIALWLGNWDVYPLTTVGAFALSAVAGLGLGWVIGDALRQETTIHHPMPQRRALVFGIAGALVITGITTAFTILTHGIDLAWLILPGLAAIAGIGLFSYLGATQTNRTKAWALEHGRQASEIGNRFEKDPAAAARFGIYTMLIWVSAFVVSIILYFTTGWTWSWIPYVVGFIAMMFLLTRMLFISDDKNDTKESGR